MRSWLAVLLTSAAIWPQTPAAWIDLRGPWELRYGARFDASAPAQTIQLPRRERDWSELLTREAWLSRRVVLPPGTAPGPLSLTLGTLDAIYEVWINGTRIGASGGWESFADAQIPQAKTYDLPVSTVTDSGELVVAIHLRRSLRRNYWQRLPDKGPYLLTSPEAAPRDAASIQAAQHWIRETPRLLLNACLLGIALLAFLGWRIDPARRELPWFAVVCALAAFNTAYGAWTFLPEARPYSARGIQPVELTSSVLRWPLLAEFCLAALGVRPRWLRAAIWLPMLALLYTIVTGRMTWTLGGRVEIWIALAVIAHEAWRHRAQPDAEGHILRFVLALPFLQRAVALLVQRRDATLGPYRLDYEDVSIALISATTLALLFRRIARSRREQQRLAGELEAARSVQALLLGHSLPPGVAATYLPASEVGGDFYFANETAHGTLVIAGDVSGKGLSAAMTVAALIGALRNRRSDAPGAVLAELNTVTLGSPGFVTCCCLLVGTETVRVASAGHPAPYFDGMELPAAAGLPLGVVPDPEYDEQELPLPEQVTLVSDGVVEAENSARELFGFDRTRAISTRSAQDIAEAARAWGQNDDITVVTVRRTA